MKFAHMADCHLGAWRHPKLQELNMESLSQLVDMCIKEKVDFILFAGDLFDSAYPPIEILKEAFSEFRKLKDVKISCFIIAGSHDYSVSGKTFLDVLEKAGFCKNVFSAESLEERNEKIILNPVIEKGIAIYGYPGKKSGLEINEIRRIRLQECPGLFRIFMLHTSIKGAIGTLPIESIDEKELPESDYYALGHLHVDYCKGKFVYAGPIFPNNFEELEELEGGSFYIVELKGTNRLDSAVDVKRIELKIKDIVCVEIEISNALTATEKIISELSGYELKDKIVLLRISGKLKQGKTADIRFSEIEDFVNKKNAYAFLKNTSKLVTEEAGVDIDMGNMENIEENIIKKYLEENHSKFNSLISQLIGALDLEKHEDERNIPFEERMLNDIKKILNV